MIEAQIQYVADPNGNLTSVLIPIELWREMEAELETAYLLRSPTMKKRLLEAIHRENGIPFEEAREKLGI